MKKYVKLFFKNAIVSGILIGIIMVLLEMKFFKIGGILYGAIPLGFLYIMFSYYIRSDITRKEKLSQLKNFSKFSIIGGVLFCFFMSIYYFILKKYNTFLWSTITLFIVMFIGIFLIIKFVKLD